MKLYIEPGLSRAKQKKTPFLHTSEFILVILVLTCAVVYIQTFAIDKLIPEARAAEPTELPSMSDKKIYEEFNGQTKTLCTDYLKNH